MNKINGKNNYNQLPVCYGNKKNGRHCNECSFDKSCSYYESSEKSIETEDKKWFVNHMFCPIGTRDFSTSYIKNKIKTNSSKFVSKNGKYVDSEQINLELITWALLFGAENKKLAQAMAHSLNPEVKNCSDIADILGISRQRLNKALRDMLNIDKKKVPDSVFKKFTGLELEVYKHCFENGETVRSVAKQLGLSKDKIFRSRQSLKLKLGKSETGKKYNNKIFQKNNIFFNSI